MSLALSVEDVSVSYVCGHGVLAEMLVSLVDRHGVVSISLTDTKLLPAGVDGQGVVPVSLPMDVTYVLYAD